MKINTSLKARRRATCLIVSWIFSASLCFPGGADADEREGRWLPSLAGSIGIGGQEMESTTSSNVRPSSREQRTLRYPWYGGSGELMTPVLLDVPGAPRLFIHGDIIQHRAGKTKLTGEGAPGPFNVPPLGGIGFTEAAIDGQGSDLTLEIDDLAYGAGIGVAFAFNIFDFNMALKPSAEWYQYSGTVEGRVHRAIKPDANPDPPDRLIMLNYSESGTWNAFGGGLELEVEAFQQRGFSVLVFALGRGYSVIGNRTLEGSDSSPANPEDDTAHFSYQAAPFIWNTGVGIRVRWVGN